MKKYILAASCALFASTAVMAQVESDNGGPVTEPITLTLTLDNVITLSYAANSPTGVGATFATAANYNSGMGLTSGGTGNGNQSTFDMVNFVVQSNRYFNVAINTTNANFTAASVTGAYASDNYLMPVGIVKWHATSAAGGTVAVDQPLTSSANGMISSAPNGGAQDFSVGFYANPLWNYAGDIYTATVDVTATQE